jgi:toluene monooxygenase electron transfer component
MDELRGAEFYVAGPPVMTTAIRELLSDSGIQVDRIRYDGFG